MIHAIQIYRCITISVFCVNLILSDNEEGRMHQKQKYIVTYTSLIGGLLPDGLVFKFKFSNKIYFRHVIDTDFYYIPLIVVA